jgi:formamidopyrimidine-DNA glycosylase
VPEGHTLHRLAREQTRRFAGELVRASSPQGRFAAGAARIDGRLGRGVEAYGKHLFHRFEGLDAALHVHLGLYGTFTDGAPPAPQPRGALRLRLTTDRTWTDLRGPIACELLEPPAVDLVLARLGPDPLRRKADPAVAFSRLSRSRTPIAVALMDQSVVAGIGNVYRAELLYRHRRDPFRPAREITAAAWSDMWSDLVALMRAGVRSGRIVTTVPADRDRRTGPASREDSLYVYRRTGLPCRVCGTPIRTVELAGRNLHWCPVCQVG